MPRIGDLAPHFEAVTTQGTIKFPDDYQGKWIILFSHPADFTPVCTSEFMTFATLESQFKELNCQLVGLSVDGLYSHIAWLRTIKEKIEYKGMKNVEVTFPLIEDITMSFKYLKPAVYDELLLIETELKEIKGPLIKFVYSIFNEENELINKGETTLAFVNAETRKPCPRSLQL